MSRPKLRIPKPLSVVLAIVVLSGLIATPRVFADPKIASSAYIESYNTPDNQIYTLDDGTSEAFLSVNGFSDDVGYTHMVASARTSYGSNKAFAIAQWSMGDYYDPLYGKGEATSRYEDQITISNPALYGISGNAFFYYDVTGINNGWSDVLYRLSLFYDEANVTQLQIYKKNTEDTSVETNEQGFQEYMFTYGVPFTIVGHLWVRAQCSGSTYPDSSAQFSNSANLIWIKIPADASLSAASGHVYLTEAPSPILNNRLYLPIIFR
jgi:hypothetical protein